MKALLAAAAALTLSACNPLVSATNNVGNVPATAQSVSLSQYMAAGGGPYWSFELTNGGNGFTMRHPTTTSQITHQGTITSQTALNGGAWLIEGQVGSQTLILIAEPVSSGVCSDGHVDGQDTVRVAWNGYLYRGCGRLTP
ncbi:MAG: hypothetical protein ABJP70_01830 [Erythrobacter sp.]